MNPSTVLTDPLIPFRAYFLAAVKKSEKQVHAMVNGKFTVIAMPNYKEAVTIYLRHYPDPTRWQRTMVWIEDGYAFIWEGLEVVLQGYSIQELQLFADRLSTLQSLKTHYETGWLTLSIRHDDKWVNLSKKQRVLQGEGLAGTEDLRNAMAMKYAAWLIGETTALVERLLNSKADFGLNDQTTAASDKEIKLNTCAYSSFEQLFLESTDIPICVNVLREFRPEKPIIGESENWIGSKKDKGIIVAWIGRLETKNKIVTLSNRKQLVVLLNNYFSNLDMGKEARVFNNIVPIDIKDRFSALLPK